MAVEGGLLTFTAGASSLRQLEKAAIQGGSRRILSAAWSGGKLPSASYAEVLRIKQTSLFSKSVF
ncbi:hypothetical protein C0081_14230 [Cohaesibacter celericrescens]|uniref:Uncharacterized protein n=2 Tax=Cohaesibacter celericrescens TaxID=2067669 RepID=A0A2N5XPT5_9HYPH|nr:hypothetical protein C0081_14230 [Cohaesibacter celericrescens]